MANRTVSVKMQLDLAGYVGPAEKAAQSTDKIGDSATKAGSKYKMGSQAIVAGAAVAGAAGALALGKIVSASMGFEKAMSGVAAVSGASAEEMQRLSDAALKAGADTSFSASQAAQAEAELAKAGVSTADILGGALRGSLDLAAAGQLDLGNAATIAANAMNIFSLEGADVASIADTLAAGANKSAADVDQLAQAMSQGGQVAASLGLDLQDTVGALSMFADAGLKGSDAGTSLKTTLQMLANPSAEAAETMKRLGLYAFDAGGNFVGLESFAGQLQDRMSGLTQEQRASALATIFGADAVRAANILYKQGATGVAEYTSAVTDQGAAGRMAAKQMDNLAGDVEQLGGSIETALIKSGSGANSMLREITQGATGAVNAFGDLPGPVQMAAVGLLAVGTGATGAIAGLGVMVPRVKAGREALREMGRAGEVADRSLGKVGKGLAIGSGVLVGLETAGLLLGKLQDAAFDAAPGVEELKSSLIGISSAAALSSKLPNLGRDLEHLGAQVQRLADPSLGDKASKLFTNIASLGNVDPGKLRDAQQNLGAIDQALSSLVQSGNAAEADRAFRLIADAAVRGGASIEQLKAALPGYRDALAGVANDSKLAADGTEKVGSAASGAAPPLSAAEQAARQLGVEFKEGASAADVLKGAIDRLNGASLSALDTDIAFRESLAGVGAAFKENGRSLSLNTEKGRANLSVISDAIKRAGEHAAAVSEQTGSVNKGSEVFARHMKQLRETAPAGSALRREIDKLIASYGKVPPKVSTNVSAPGATTAKGQADAVTAAANKIPRTKATQVSAPGAETAAGKMNRVTQMANGIPERETVTIGAVDQASGTIARVSRSLASLDGTRATTYVETIRIGTGAGAITGRASGGPVEAGRVYRVNESGAEGYFVPPADGHIINHRDFAAMLAGRTLTPVPSGGRSSTPTAGITLSITVNPAPGMDEVALARRVAGQVNGALGAQADLLYRTGTGG